MVNRFLAMLLFGTSARDPLRFAAVIALLVVVALVAACIPAGRAALAGPIVALRHESSGEN